MEKIVTTNEVRKESLWDMVHEEVERELDRQFFTDPGEFLDAAQMAEEKSIMLERERLFVTKVTDGVARALENGNGTCLVLFDIDETMGFYDFESTPPKTVFRPSLVHVLENIKAKNVPIGILSSRSREALLQQLEDPNHLARVASYIDRNFVFSSRLDKMPAFGSYDEGKEYILNEYADKRHVIARDKVEPDNVMLNQGDITKIMELGRIKESMNDTNIVSVDDFAFPAYLDKEHGFFGVPIGRGDGSFHRP